MTLRTRNPYDYPLLHHNYLTDPDDVARLVEGAMANIIDNAFASFHWRRDE